MEYLYVCYVEVFLIPNLKMIECAQRYSLLAVAIRCFECYKEKTLCCLSGCHAVAKVMDLNHTVPHS